MPETHPTAVDSAPSTEASPEIPTAPSTPEEELGRTLAFARAMPKCELHLHAEGAISPELALKFAARNDTGHLLPFTSVEEGLAQYKFSNLSEFIKVIDTVILVLRRRDDFYDYTMDYLVKAAEQNVRHVEFQFSPQVTHQDAKRDEMLHGIRDAMRDGVKKFGITSCLTLSLIRTFSVESAIECIDHMAKVDATAFHAIGLVGCEMGHPPQKFAAVFEHARKVVGPHLKVVVHAGEEGPPSYIIEALALGVERIDHGVAIRDSAELMEKFVENQVPIAMCPLSNLALKVVDDMSELPLRKFLSMGMRVSVNSDDPPFFGGYLNENYEAVVKAFTLSMEEVYQLGHNSITGSFAADARKKEMLRELEQCFGKFK